MYHIGLTIIVLAPWEKLLLHMNKFFEAISTDPDLSPIPLAHQAKVLQILYIATGSFFAGIGKTAFLKSFYLYTRFITEQTPVDGMGSLVHTSPDSNGFLADIFKRTEELLKMITLSASLILSLTHLYKRNTRNFIMTLKQRFGQEFHLRMVYHHPIKF